MTAVNDYGFAAFLSASGNRLVLQNGIWHSLLSVKELKELLVIYRTSELYDFNKRLRALVKGASNHNTAVFNFNKTLES